MYELGVFSEDESDDSDFGNDANDGAKHGVGTSEGSSSSEDDDSAESADETGSELGNCESESGDPDALATAIGADEGDPVGQSERGRGRR